MQREATLDNQEEEEVEDSDEEKEDTGKPSWKHRKCGREDTSEEKLGVEPWTDVPDMRAGGSPNVAEEKKWIERSQTTRSDENRQGSNRSRRDSLNRSEDDTRDHWEREQEMQVRSRRRGCETRSASKMREGKENESDRERR